MDWINLLTPLAASAVIAAIPLMLAALGELVTEKSGVLNLGVEGTMLMGAIGAFAVTVQTGSLWLGVLAGIAAGVAMSAIFAWLTLSLMANQVATGLALTIFGIGLSAYVGRPYTDATIPMLRDLPIPGLSSLPVLGPSIFSLNPLGYLSVVLLVAIAWFLYRTRAGLVLRSIGEAPAVAHAIGYPVVRIRYLATLFGGAMSGLAGAYYSVGYLRLWQENLTAGRGWIALALVVFATWRPGRTVLGALLFGVVMALQFQAQAMGIRIPSQALASLPYLATIAVLVIISRNRQTIRLNAPASLGKPFFAGS
ncbi:ABC transporter permease [Pandoraea apista]|uniref:ABC transporter permease n=1 Tax=Pandoraea apista TaxID=93218 RepID=A0A0B5F6F6_9BURK|nr:ABC transporter permease [Pandoraea apista]AJE99809.1 ABC transporter permease [Pandoraea apista]AKH73941.1 ABC transporter permease [Pandoraea apista]AKI62488.1 ABC transporter permease [Pandoraea apista]ALS64211.1 ABC transporter permease [Pandoraea apista]OXS96460.1 ABC transporter permease [Pandoraea apista]